MKHFCIENCNELVDIVFDGGEDDYDDISFNEDLVLFVMSNHSFFLIIPN